MQLILIAAMAKNRVIGKDGDMPWRLPADFAHFKRMTMGHPMLMGRATFESLPGVLPGRRHLVVTRQTDWTCPGCEVFSTIDAALEAVVKEPKVMVIGGMQLYQQTLPRADQLIITEIDQPFDGDRYFPQWPADQWQEVSRDVHLADEKNHWGYAFVHYKRI